MTALFHTAPGIFLICPNLEAFLKSEKIYYSMTLKTKDLAILTGFLGA
jgi:hypothetical protein